MKLLVQSNDVMRSEKIAVRSLALSSSAIEICRLALEDIPSLGMRVPISHTPIGTVEFCRARMHQYRIKTPNHLSYPKPIRDFLQRTVSVRRFSEVEIGMFVKPYTEVKKFTGHIKGEALPEDKEIIAQLGDDLVWASEPVQFLAEVRYYVLAGQVVGSARYDAGPETSPLPEIGIVQKAIQGFNADTPPAGYALDFGVTQSGKTALVEANDGWALGLYRNGSIVDARYLDLISARWREIVSTGQQI